MALQTNLERVLAHIYESALETHAWIDTATAIADFCGAENVALVVVDPRNDYADVTTPRANPDVVAEYDARWWASDPTVMATSATAPGVITDLRNTGREVFLASEFYNEYWRHSGLGTERLATNLLVDDDGAFSSFVLQASTVRDEITTDMRERFGILVPHVMRAVSAERRLRQLEFRAGMPDLGSATGFAVVNDLGRIEYADRQGASILAEGGWVRSRNGILELSDPGAQARFKTLLSNNATGLRSRTDTRWISLGSRPGRAEFGIELVPMRRWSPLVEQRSRRSYTYLLFHDPIGEAKRNIAVLKERYGLTAAEARLALELARGDGRQAAAERCGISVNTARTHITRIFEKLDVSRQAQLTALVGQLMDG